MGLAVVGGGGPEASTGPDPRVAAVRAFSSSAGDRPSPIKRLGTSGYRSDPYQR